MCVCILLSVIHLSVDGHLGCVHVLANTIIYFEREAVYIHITFLKLHYNCSIYQLMSYIS